MSASEDCPTGALRHSCRRSSTSSACTGWSRESCTSRISRSCLTGCGVIGGSAPGSSRAPSTADARCSISRWRSSDGSLAMAQGGDLPGGSRLRQLEILDEYRDDGAGVRVLDRCTPGLVEVAADRIPIGNHAAGEPLQDGISLLGIDDDPVVAAHGARDGTAGKGVRQNGAAADRDALIDPRPIEPIILDDRRDRAPRIAVVKHRKADPFDLANEPGSVRDAFAGPG